MKRYGLLGAKLGHSFSREIHQAIGGYDYELIELTEPELADFLTRKDFAAVNVTIPYKKTVIPYLDEISAEAAAIGAVNCIRNDGGRLVGHNTDFAGLKALAERLDAEKAIRGRKVLILGTGGTSDTAAAVCGCLGAAQIIKVSRRPQPAAAPAGAGKPAEIVSYAEAAKVHNDAAFIINTTPCGTYPQIYRSPLDLSPFAQLEGALDVIYNPLRSELTSEALRRGLRAEGGLYMLVAQAVGASEFFFAKRYDEGLTESIFRKIYRQKSNVVLAGMPASGKTTVASIIAERTGRAVFDTDEMVERKAGLKISEIFSRYGEEYFRDLETQVVREAAVSSGAVIATGGGAILREANVRDLKMNGEIYFLDRDPDLLLPTADRPLAKDRQAIRRRYEERYPLYLAAADHKIENDGDAAAAAAAILEEYI